MRTVLLRPMNLLGLVAVGAAVVRGTLPQLLSAVLVLAIVGLQLGVRHHRRPHSGIGGIGVASGIGGINGASAAGGGGATISLENGATQ